MTEPQGEPQGEPPNEPQASSNAPRSAERGAATGAEQSEEQRRYAAWLEGGTRVGLALLVVSFVAYAFGLLPARVPPEQLAQWWGLPLATYLGRSGTTTGWSWLDAVGFGDSAALLGIAWLAACSAPCLLALAPLARRHGQGRLAWLCLGEVAVIALAASGLVTAGH